MYVTLLNTNYCLIVSGIILIYKKNKFYWKQNYESNHTPIVKPVYWLQVFRFQSTLSDYDLSSLFCNYVKEMVRNSAIKS